MEKVTCNEHGGEYWQKENHGCPICGSVMYPIPGFSRNDISRARRRVEDRMRKDPLFLEKVLLLNNEI